MNVKQLLVLPVIMSIFLPYHVPLWAQHEGHTAHTAKPADQGAVQMLPGEPTPTVEIPPDKQQLIGVRTTQVAVHPIRKTIRATGRVEYDEKKLATVNVKVEGWIEKLYVDYTGRYVKQGEPVAEIYSPELFAAEQEYLDIQALSRKQAETSQSDSQIARMLQKDSEALLAAARQRLRLLDISEAQIAMLEKAGKPMRTMTLYSPASGYVTQKTAVQGAKVMPGEKLFDLADLSTVWVTADIYEADLPYVREGATARIAVSTMPGKTFNAKVAYLYPTLAAETRTAKVRFALANPGNRLKPQIFTDIEIQADLGSGLAVPADAVIETGTRSVVYVDRGEGNFEPRAVRLGRRGGTWVEVLSGLKAGEKVASSATFLIDSEAQLKGILPAKN